jgi:hypothetical protein
VAGAKRADRAGRPRWSALRLSADAAMRMDTNDFFPCGEKLIPEAVCGRVQCAKPRFSRVSSPCARSAPYVSVRCLPPADPNQKKPQAKISRPTYVSLDVS